MDSHKCKLCSRAFTNGRALGGHMKAHLTAAAPPLPPPHPSSPSSSSSFSASDHLQFPPEQQPTLYELPENLKKTFRFSDPFYDILLQDRESENESKNPTRKRSKRSRKIPPPPPPDEPEPVSSVSDTSQKEDLAMWLIMLSRDRRIENQIPNEIPNQKLETGSFEKLGELKVKKAIRRKNKFPLQTELQEQEEEDQEQEEESLRNRRIFQCPICLKHFGSGQALGGHKRSHLASSTNKNGAVTVNSSVSFKLDLNLPAPHEEDDYSVVSEA